MRQRWLRIRAWFLPDPPPPDRSGEVAARYAAIEALRESDARRQEAGMEMARELIEAQHMAGRGPWTVGPETAQQTDRLIRAAMQRQNSSDVPLRESLPLAAQGAWQDIELALQNIEWKREVNFSWLEFSRWGIQQIILISRLHFIKNPLIQRGINIAAQYVFGRGVSVSSPDEDANQVLKDFFERNQKTLGQIALTDLERRKYYDGNIFFVFFADKTSKGTVDVRTIDSTEIMDIVTDPEDADTPWYYKRVWTERGFDPASATVVRNNTKTAWYPALGFDAPAATIGGDPVMVDNPILHRKCGQVSKWNFGVPLVFAALDWAKSARKYLEACLSTNLALAQFAMSITTKGGMQAMGGIKSQLQTTVGTGSGLWDQNPPAGVGSTFVSGPGTELKAFNTSGAGSDPEKVRQYKLQVAMVFGVPETFFADVSTGNLATATTLDRPTELNFIEKQEAWREDLETIAQFVLKVSLGAPSGKLREAMARRNIEAGKVVIREVAREHTAGGRFVEVPNPAEGTVEVSVTFPAIREGDLPALIQACATAMYPAGSGSKGIDEKQGVLWMTQTLDIDNPDRVVDEMYPNYDPERDQEEPPPPPVNAGPAINALAKAVEAMRTS